MAPLDVSLELTKGEGSLWRLLDCRKFPRKNEKRSKRSVVGDKNQEKTQMQVSNQLTRMTEELIGA